SAARATGQLRTAGSANLGRRGPQESPGARPPRRAPDEEVRRARHWPVTTRIRNEGSSPRGGHVGRAPRAGAADGGPDGHAGRQDGPHGDEHGEQREPDPARGQPAPGDAEAGHGGRREGGGRATSSVLTGRGLFRLETSITMAEEKIPKVTSALEEAKSRKAQLDSDIKKHKADRAEGKDALAKAAALRSKEATEYAKLKSEMETNLSALAAAIKA
ncbi:unnamed protein product, partial [Prorocentrum cordatum]